MGDLGSFELGLGNLVAGGKSANECPLFVWVSSVLCIVLPGIQPILLLSLSEFPVLEMELRALPMTDKRIASG